MDVVWSINVMALNHKRLRVASLSHDGIQKFQKGASNIEKYIYSL